MFSLDDVWLPRYYLLRVWEVHEAPLCIYLTDRGRCCVFSRRRIATEILLTASLGSSWSPTVYLFNWPREVLCFLSTYSDRDTTYCEFGKFMKPHSSRTPFSQNICMIDTIPDDGRGFAWYWTASRKNNIRNNRSAMGRWIGPSRRTHWAISRSSQSFKQSWTYLGADRLWNVSQHPPLIRLFKT